jgi:predicted dehydrogenase
VSAERYRVAVVGCGAVGSENDLGRSARPAGPLSHAGAWRAEPRATLVAAADVDRERLTRFGSAWDVSALYADYREMLERERPDVVSVCVPDELHADVVLAACGAGVRGLFCEKPLATTLADADRMLAACERAGVIVAVNYFRRWNPTLSLLRAELASGTLGRVLRVNAWYPGGVLHNGTHAIDLVRWLAGEIVHVQALGARWLDPKDPGVDALCRTTDQVPCVLHACDAATVNLLEVDLLTTVARVRITQNGRRIERQPIVADTVYPRYRMLRPEPEVTATAWERCFMTATSDLLACLGTAGVPRCSGYDGYRAMEIALAARRSDESGGAAIDVTPRRLERTVL